MTFGFAGVFGFPENTVYTIFCAFVASCLWWTTIICLAMVPFHFVFTKYPHWVVTPYVFSLCHTVASVSLLGEALGTFTCIGNAVLDLAPLRPLASLIGIFGVEFTVLLPGSVAALAFLDPARKLYRDAGAGAGYMLLGMLAVLRVSVEMLDRRLAPGSCE